MDFAKAYLHVVSWTPSLPDDLVLPTQLVLPSRDEGNFSAEEKGDHVISLSAWIFV